MRSWTNEQLIEAVKLSNKLSDVAKKLGLTNYGANSKTIKKYISQLSIETSHFLSRGEQLKEARALIKSLTDDELFSVNNVDRKYIKKRIIQSELIPYECNVCYITDWQEQKLSLHLDHINGINNDNRLENLRFLCPNCHSLTESYCAKNKKKMPEQQNKCVDCGKKIHKSSIRCSDCIIPHRRIIRTKIEWPPTKLLISLVSEIGYVGTARQLGVSDNAVKKRIRNHPND